ncbi:MAG: putative quinol monooxygenase [Anaerovoracaceae bacterium]
MKKIIITYIVKDGMREEFYRELNNIGVGEKSRNEEGNIKYAYYAALEDDNKLVLLEVWENGETLKKHMESDHFKELIQIKEKYVVETESDIFDC